MIDCGMLPALARFIVIEGATGFLLLIKFSQCVLLLVGIGRHYGNRPASVFQLDFEVF
jgi:hypothetical protein